MHLQPESKNLHRWIFDPSLWINDYYTESNTVIYNSRLLLLCGRNFAFYVMHIVKMFPLKLLKGIFLAPFPGNHFSASLYKMSGLIRTIFA